jgi:hypothetical protein
VCFEEVAVLPGKGVLLFSRGFVQSPAVGGRANISGTEMDDCIELVALEGGR